MGPRAWGENCVQCFSQASCSRDDSSPWCLFSPLRSAPGQAHGTVTCTQIGPDSHSEPIPDLRVNPNPKGNPDLRVNPNPRMNPNFRSNPDLGVNPNPKANPDPRVNLDSNSNPNPRANPEHLPLMSLVQGPSPTFHIPGALIQEQSLSTAGGSEKRNKPGFSSGCEHPLRPSVAGDKRMTAQSSQCALSLSTVSPTPITSELCPRFACPPRSSHPAVIPSSWAEPPSTSSASGQVTEQEMGSTGGGGL